MTGIGHAFTPLQRLLHWVVAICILAMLFIGVGMVSTVMPKYLLLVSIHKSLGIIILVLALIRLAIRLSYGAPALPAERFPDGCELVPVPAYSVASTRLGKVLGLRLPIFHGNEEESAGTITWCQPIDIPTLNDPNTITDAESRNSFHIVCIRGRGESVAYTHKSPSRCRPADACKPARSGPANPNARRCNHTAEVEEDKARWISLDLANTKDGHDGIAWFIKNWGMPTGDCYLTELQFWSMRNLMRKLLRSATVPQSHHLENGSQESIFRIYRGESFDPATPLELAHRELPALRESTRATGRMRCVQALLHCPQESDGKASAAALLSRLWRSGQSKGVALWGRRGAQVGKGVRRSEVCRAVNAPSAISVRPHRA